jgi:pimeloyl-ACP methyl ester carboxylesterase
METLSAASAHFAPARQSRYSWHHGERTIEIAVSDSGGSGPAWLLLPALSTISSRREWQPFADTLAEDQASGTAAPPPRLIAIDWPGFGESDRPRIAYNAEMMARCLVDVRRDLCPTDCGLIASGHAAGIALLAAARQGLAFRDWILVAPTWRGPFPTMAGRRSRAFPVLRALVEAPLLGPLLYRLNTTRSVLAWMSRRHVDVAGPGLTPEGIAARQQISRQPGARFASAAFVTGALDPFIAPDGWVRPACNLQAPLTVVLADQLPPKSLVQMQALAAVAGRVAHLPGRLGAHEESGAELARLLRESGALTGTAR